METRKAIIGLLFFCVGQMLFAQDITITQNVDPTVVNINGSVRCSVDADDVANNPSLFVGMYRDNYFARAFDLTNDHNINTDFVINNIQVGVRFAKNITVDINIYSANTTDLSDPSLNPTLLSSPNEYEYTFSSQVSNLLIDIPINDITIPAGEILVVEVFAPNSGTATNQDFAIGSNISGQNEPCYIKAPNCSTPNYIDSSTFGSNGQAYIINVTGELPINYRLTANFDNNFNDIHFFENGAAGSNIRTTSLEADSNDVEYIIDADLTHQWFNSTSPLNSEFSLNYNDQYQTTLEESTITNPPNNITFGNIYTLQIEGFAFSARNAVIMETTDTPVEITNLTFDSNVGLNANVPITVDLSAIKSPEEKVFIHYSNDEFVTSELAEVSFNNPTDLSGTATIPGSFNTGGIVQFYAYSTTVAATTASNHDLISLSILNNSGAYYSYHVNSEYITKEGASHWNIPSSWLGNTIPPNSANVTIAHDLNILDNREVQNLVIRDGISLNITTGNILNIRANGNINSPASEIGQIVGNGLVNFVDTGSITGELSINNVDLNAGVNFGTQCTITGNLTINSDGFVDSDSPIYGPNSTLIYNTGGTYGRNSEWSNANATQSNPANVIIQSDTTLNMGANNTTDDAVITGNLTVESGSVLALDFDPNDMEAPLVVGGNFINDGTTSLSGQIGGDLKLLRDFTDIGTFNFNNRALIFEGTEVQELNASNGFEIPFMVIAKTAGEVVLNQDIILSGITDALQMSDQGVLSLNGHQLQVGNGADTRMIFNDDAALKGSPTSKIRFNSTNTTPGNLKFLQTGDDNSLAEFEMEGSGSINLVNELNIHEKFILKNGNFITNDSLVFRSNATQTAIIPEVTDGTLTGEIRTERFYPMGNRAFRYVSSPVTSTAFIRDQWQEGQNNTGNNYPTDNINDNDGLGTHITGTILGNDLGFDATGTGNPSMFTWDNQEANPAWAPIPNTNDTPLTAGKAYALMVRGDRSTNLNSNESIGNSTTLRAWGTPKIGQHQVTTNIASGNFALIGNPYQAQVDLTLVDKTGFGNFFYIWDPTIGQKGGYAAVEIDGTTVTVTTTTPSAGTEANELLQVGQAFFIQATADNPTMTFQEIHKSEEINNLATFSVPNYANINVNLYRDGNLLVDGLRIRLAEDMEDEVNFDDAQKLWNNQEYFAIDKNPDWLMVERRSIPESEAILFYLDNYFATQYQFQIQVQQLNSHQVYLHDAYLDDNYALGNDQEYNHTFEVDTSIPESLGPNRFSLYFEETPLSTISVDAPSIQTYPNPVTQGNLNLVWPLAVGNEEATQVKLYDVLGREVFSNSYPHAEHLSINLSDLATGLYVLKATRGDAAYTTKVLVEKR